MAIQDFHSQANNNTTIQNISIAEGCPPGNVNDAIRQLMSDIKNGLWGSTGTATRSNAGTVRFANAAELTEGKDENLVVTLLDAKKSEAKLSETFTAQLETVNTFSVPKGGIILWSGAVNAIPAGWVLCDGTNSTPNLCDRFVVGAGGAYAVKAAAGAGTHTHTAGTTVNAATLSVAQMAYHNHPLANAAVPGGSNAIAWPPGYAITYNTASGFAGSNAAHAHTAGTSVQVGNHLPPYFALAYIMKL